MDIISYEYTKQRKEFGVAPEFTDAPTRVLGTVAANPEDEANWTTKQISSVELDCVPSISEHTVQTDVIEYVSQGTLHTQGGWPSEVKSKEPQEKEHFLKRIWLKPEYQTSVRHLKSVATDVVQENNTIDLFEEYFVDESIELATEPPSAKTIAVFKDPKKSVTDRTVTKICWHPDGSAKMATSYSVMKFQQMPENMPLESYIWDVNSPNEPIGEILPKSPLGCLVYNPKTSDHLAGGSYNGLVGFWDTRRGSKWVACSEIEKSHHDPVYDIFWIQSRTGNECVSTSTDGQLLWWDVRNLKGGPTESVHLKRPDDVIFGATCMTYRIDAGATKYLIGTEQGQVVYVDKKTKGNAKETLKAYGEQMGRHHGPIYGLERHPSVSPKYFMTIGDWTARIWDESLPQPVPIMTTRYDGSYLSAGCWSPTRPGVFFTAKVNGTLDIWDCYHKQNDAVYSTTVGSSLASMSIHQQGKWIAVGAEDGTTTVLQISDSLVTPQANERKVITDMFERESAREKQLAVRAKEKKRERQLAKKKAERGQDKKVQDKEKQDEVIHKLEQDFFHAVGLDVPESLGMESKGDDSQPSASRAKAAAVNAAAEIDEAQTEEAEQQMKVADEKEDQADV